MSETTTIQVGDLDADELFVGLLGETPRTLAYVDNRVRTQDLNPGILRRLLAALTSAGDRGSVDWQYQTVGEPWEAPGYQSTNVRRQEVRLSVGSTSGHMSGRSYWLEAVIIVQVDVWGRVEYVPHRGSALVSSAAGQEWTRFAGESVAALVLDVWRTRGAAMTIARDLLVASKEYVYASETEFVAAATADDYAERMRSDRRERNEEARRADEAVARIRAERVQAAKQAEREAAELEAARRAEWESMPQWERELRPDLDPDR